MTAFTRRYSARIAAFICTLRGHEWSRWRTINGGTITVTGGPPLGTMAAHGERKCKRCGLIEFGAAPKKRKPNAADTLQGAKHG